MPPAARLARAAAAARRGEPRKSPENAGKGAAAAERRVLRRSRRCGSAHSRANEGPRKEGAFIAPGEKACQRGLQVASPGMSRRHEERAAEFVRRLAMALEQAR